MTTFVKRIAGKPEKYTMAQLRRDNPKISFPSEITPRIMQEFGLFELKDTPAPKYNRNTETLSERVVNNNGKYVREWYKTPRPDSEFDEEFDQANDALKAVIVWVAQMNNISIARAKADLRIIYRQVCKGQ